MLRWIAQILGRDRIAEEPADTSVIAVARRPRLGRAPLRDAGLVDATARATWQALAPAITRRLAGWTLTVEDEPPVDDPDVCGHCYADAQLIVIYRLPHLELAPTRIALEREVAETVLHEVAHALGLDDEEAVSALGPLGLPLP